MKKGASIKCGGRGAGWDPITTYGACINGYSHSLEQSQTFYILLFQPPVLQRLVSDECAEIQRDEMLALKCIFEEDLSLVEEDGKCFKISLIDSDALQDQDEQVDVWFR